MSKRDHEVNFIFAPSNNAIPKPISNAQITIANDKAAGPSHGILKTSKYSFNLYEKPRGSLALINPEMIKSIPTSTLKFVQVFS